MPMVWYAHMYVDPREKSDETTPALNTNPNDEKYVLELQNEKERMYILRPLKCI